MSSNLGRTTEALATAREAYASLESVGSEEGESRVRLIYAELLAASGAEVEAAAAISPARDSLLAHAEKIRDPAGRERFLHNVPDNARTLELAHGWLGELTP